MRTRIGPNFVLLVLAGLAGHGWAGEHAPSDEACQWGAEEAGLRIGLRTLGPIPKESSQPSFEVAIQNVGRKPVVLWLGTMLGNGRRQFTEAVTLTLTSSEGKTIQLKHNWDRLPAIIGRMDPMVVPLPAGCTYTIPVNFQNYWFIGPRSTPTDWLPKGDYTAVGEFTGKTVPGEEHKFSMIPALPFWEGLIRSGSVLYTSSGRPPERSGSGEGKK